MDWLTHLEPWLTQATPLFPDLALMRVARHLSWAVVLVFGLLWLTRGWRPRWQGLRRGLALALLGLALLPDPWSLAFWLGLAFQMPSLSSVLLCGTGLWALWHRAPAPGGVVASRMSAPAAWRHAALAGSVLGWLLLLDTFALLPLPVSFYSLGFSPAALALVALLSFLPWVSCRGASARPVCQLSGLLAAVLFGHVLLRLPDGNLWNALLDPWLWLGLQGWWLQQAWRRLRARAAPAG